MKLIPHEGSWQIPPSADSEGSIEISDRGFIEGWYYVLKVVHVPNRWCGQQKEEARALALLHDNDWSPGPAMGGWWSAEYTETTINIESIRRSDDSEPYLESDPNWTGLDQYRQQH